MSSWDTYLVHPGDGTAKDASRFIRDLGAARLNRLHSEIDDAIRRRVTKEGGTYVKLSFAF